LRLYLRHRRCQWGREEQNIRKPDGMWQEVCNLRFGIFLPVFSVFVCGAYCFFSPFKTQKHFRPEMYADGDRYEALAPQCCRSIVEYGVERRRLGTYGTPIDPITY
jgi:hypothetical protein